MKLDFTLETSAGTRALQVDVQQLVIAGWAGRNREAIEHHIEELAAIGVPRPSAVPLYYRVAANQLTQAAQSQIDNKMFTRMEALISSMTPASSVLSFFCDGSSTLSTNLIPLWDV